MKCSYKVMTQLSAFLCRHFFMKEAKILYHFLLPRPRPRPPPPCLLLLLFVFLLLLFFFWFFCPPFSFFGAGAKLITICCPVGTEKPDFFIAETAAFITFLLTRAAEPVAFFFFSGSLFRAAAAFWPAIRRSRRAEAFFSFSVFAAFLIAAARRRPPPPPRRMMPPISCLFCVFRACLVTSFSICIRVGLSELAIPRRAFILAFRRARPVAMERSAFETFLATCLGFPPREAAFRRLSTN